jgi:hypothetical protein
MFFYKKLVTIYIYRKNSLCSIFLVNCSVHDNKCYCNDFIKSFANGVSEVPERYMEESKVYFNLHYARTLKRRRALIKKGDARGIASRITM